MTRMTFDEWLGGRTANDIDMVNAYGDYCASYKEPEQSEGCPPSALDMSFITQAANTRAELKQVVDGYEAMKAENGRMREALELAYKCQLNRIVKGGDPDIVNVGKKRLAIYEQALKGLSDE